MSTYKRLLNELKQLDYPYKIDIIQNGFLIDFTYKNNDISIIYTDVYPFKPPDKIFINKINVMIIYKNIMDKNKDIKNCLCCSSLLCQSNWSIKYNIKYNIINEIDKIFEYRKYHIYKRLLNLIAIKYTSQDISYMYSYLLN